LSFLLDTNALSEPMRSFPNVGYEAWLESVESEHALFTSVISLGEMRRGVSLTAQGVKRDRLEGMMQTLMSTFGDRILPITGDIALAWGELSARLRRSGRHPGLVDELLAATALVHSLTVVTRNVTDFEDSGCKILCPWS
jgi:predicted nucleic acid-binding protein